MIIKTDHMVITTKKAIPMTEFYQKLGFTVHDRGDRYELFAGDFKINLHIYGKELLPHAKNIGIGCNDFCFEIGESIDSVYNKLKEKGLTIELGIVERHGVNGRMKSIYLRDPDENLIELSSYE